MKANELRTGNWINVFTMLGWDAKQVSANEILIIENMEKGATGFMAEGITFTEEWAEKFGFTKEERFHGGTGKHMENIWKKGMFEFATSTGRIEINFSDNQYCSFPMFDTKVHQFQNAYFILEGHEAELKKK